VRDFRLVEQVSRFFDVAVSLAVLVVSGRLEQYPDLELIAATGGGGVALIHNRLDAVGRGRPPAEGVTRAELSRPPSEYLRNVYVDTANQNRAGQLANLELMGPERMLFGTDSPPLATPLEEAIDMVRELPVAQDAQDAILEGNARRLFALDGARA
jgi:aminocarboxymuconate-semialdehyde decarboxylase